MPIPGKINGSGGGYDWRKTAIKALKTAAVAGVGYFLADPSLGAALLGLIPADFRALAVIALPALITAVRNWIKNQGGVL